MKHLFRDPVSKGFEQWSANLAALRDPRDKRIVPFEATPEQAETNLAALKEKYAANPLPDCSALMKREGEYEGEVK